MTNLLGKIRGRVASDTITAKKIKKVQVKYERYDPVKKSYKVVKLKDGGGPRFIDVNMSCPITFEEIREKGQRLYFDNDNSNNFFEELDECCITITTVSGMPLNESENLWDYIYRKGIVLSKTIFLIRSDAWNEEADSLPPAFAGCEASQTSKRKLCGTCSCTYLGDECLICHQNAAYQCSLQADEIQGQRAILDAQEESVQSLMHNMDFTNDFNGESLFDTEFSNSDIADTDIKDIDNDHSSLAVPATIAEVRALRVNHFNQQFNQSFDPNDKIDQKTLILKINRLKLKDDLIKEFKRPEVSL